MELPDGRALACYATLGSTSLTAWNEVKSVGVLSLGSPHFPIGLLALTCRYRDCTSGITVIVC